MSDLIPVEPSGDEGVLRFVLDLSGSSVDPDPSGDVISDYNLLDNLPKINGVTLIGNISPATLGLHQRMYPITLSEIAELPEL